MMSMISRGLSLQTSWKEWIQKKLCLYRLRSMKKVKKKKTKDLMTQIFILERLPKTSSGTFTRVTESLKILI